MNKFSLLALTFLCCFLSLNLSAQESRFTISNDQDEYIFYHTIQRGETVYSIATMYGLKQDDIFQLNPGSRDGIRAGDKLRIPQPSGAQRTGEHYTFHTIKRGENPFRLTQEYNVSIQDLMDANPGLTPETFYADMVIRIPPTRIESLPTTQVEEVTKYLDYTVQRQETRYSLCRKFNISSAELLKLNPKLEDGVKAGMVIRIPVKTEEVVTSAGAPVATESEVNAVFRKKEPNQIVQTINVALLLPFNAQDLVSAHPDRVKFVEYYEGFLLALDSIKQMGQAVDLITEDLGTGTQYLNYLLQSGRLRDRHLIIGGVENGQVEMLANYAKQNEIKYVVPFSRNDVVLENEQVFQINTPLSYLNDNAAQMAGNLFTGCHVVFVNDNESVSQSSFIHALRKELDQKGITCSEITYLPETFQQMMAGALRPDQMNVIVPTVETPEIVQKIKKPLRYMAESNPTMRITLFGYPQWQTYNTEEFLDDFFALNTFFYSHFYVNNLVPTVKNFYEKFNYWYGKNIQNQYFPRYALLGFDTGIYFLGVVMHLGVNFENDLHRIAYPSLQTGFNFERVNNWSGFINTNVFMVHYRRDYIVERIEMKELLK